MALSLKIQGGIILLWAFLFSAGVTSKQNECWSFLCDTEANLNCTCNTEMPNWLVPTICLIPLAIICSCCLRLCLHYYNERQNICLQEGSSQHSPSMCPVPDVVSVQNFELSNPPTYEEAVGKQQRSPIPLDDPAAYEDIALHSVFSRDFPHRITNIQESQDISKKKVQDKETQTTSLSSSLLTLSSALF
ncbi:uncharacterized protein [Erythrolamprus reginae]|uniref:uncharacterized protein isoform X2 n=1 Tax=Erythrolamprus reginae TaxID=121349 RepID=UPI00396CAFEF